MEKFGLKRTPQDQTKMPAARCTSFGNIGLVESSASYRDLHWTWFGKEFGVLVDFAEDIKITGDLLTIVSMKNCKVT
jgi:hypothetical protein